MNKIIICVLIISILSSCKDQAYLHHKLQFEKVADNCAGGQQSFQMNSNINGERYEFNKCLPENFAKDDAVF